MMESVNCLGTCTCPSEAFYIATAFGKEILFVFYDYCGLYFFPFFPLKTVQSFKFSCCFPKNKLYLGKQSVMSMKKNKIKLAQFIYPVIKLNWINISSQHINWPIQFTIFVHGMFLQKDCGVGWRESFL